MWELWLKSHKIIIFWFPTEKNNRGQIQQITRLGWTLNLWGEVKLSGGQGTLPSLPWMLCGSVALAQSGRCTEQRALRGGTERRTMGLWGCNAQCLCSLTGAAASSVPSTGSRAPSSQELSLPEARLPRRVLPWPCRLNLCAPLTFPQQTR